MQQVREEKGRAGVEGEQDRQARRAWIRQGLQEQGLIVDRREEAEMELVRKEEAGREELKEVRGKSRGWG
eukprot:692652-Hanusia_phi.AAC.2